MLKARAAQQAASANARILELNAGYADQAAAGAVQRGAALESRVRLDAGKITGQQIAGRVAAGVGLSGSAADTIAETAGMSELDALTVRNNAALEAWGFRTKGQGFRYQAANEIAAGDSAAKASILGGITGAARATLPMLRLDGGEIPDWVKESPMGGAGYT